MYKLNDTDERENLSDKFDTVSIYIENDNNRYAICLPPSLSLPSHADLSLRVLWYSFILCHTTLSNLYMNGVERADMCEISLIFVLGWQWWYKRGPCTTRIVPCTGWQISPRSDTPVSRVAVSTPCKYIRGWSSHWRGYRFRGIYLYICIINVGKNYIFSM